MLLHKLTCCLSPGPGAQRSRLRLYAASGQLFAEASGMCSCMMQSHVRRLFVAGSLR
jgi:hypothetical protein